MVLRASRDVPDKEASREHVATQEKRVKMESLVSMASMEKMAKVELRDLLEPVERLAEEELKVPKARPEREERWD